MAVAGLEDRSDRRQGMGRSLYNPRSVAEEGGDELRDLLRKRQAPLLLFSRRALHEDARAASEDLVVCSRGRVAALFDLLALFHPASSKHLQLLVRRPHGHIHALHTWTAGVIMPSVMVSVHVLGAQLLDNRIGILFLRSELRWRLAAPTFLVTWLERGNIPILS